MEHRDFKTDQSLTPVQERPHNATSITTIKSIFSLELGTVQYFAPVFLAFSIYSLRIPLIPWIWQGSGLDIFLPILSPVYRQAEHWQGKIEKNSIICHIVFGIPMLLLGTLQFDKDLRRQRPVLHRWCGRCYVLCGLITIISLRGLISSVGSGSASSGRSEALAMFIDLTSILWVLTTAIGVIAALYRRFSLHRDAMAFSVALGAVPIFQRGMNWAILAPLAMIIRCYACLNSDKSPLLTTWGPPGDSYSLLFGSCDPEEAQVLDNRASPLVFSLDGYGEGEQASFPASAWVGLLMIIIWGAPRVAAHFFSPAKILVSEDDAQLLSSQNGSHMWRYLRYLFKKLVQEFSKHLDIKRDGMTNSKYICSMLILISKDVVVLIVGLCVISVIGVIIPVSLAFFPAAMLMTICLVPEYASYLIYRYFFNTVS